LGVVSDRYLVEFYGIDAPSFLHRNGTDRLWVSWPLASRRVEERLKNIASEVAEETIARLVESDENNVPLVNSINFENAPEQLSIEVPTDISSIEQLDSELAAQWRSSTRAAFSGAFDAGFFATEFIRGQTSGTYILRRKREGSNVN